MDREKILLLCNRINKGESLNISEVTELIIEYCTAKGKNIEYIKKYIPIAANLGILDNNIRQILQEYSKEYNLIKVIDKNNKVLLIY